MRSLYLSPMKKKQVNMLTFMKRIGPYPESKNSSKSAVFPSTAYLGLLNWARGLPRWYNPVVYPLVYP